MPVTVYPLPIPPYAVIIVRVARRHTCYFVAIERGTGAADNFTGSNCVAAGACEDEIGEGHNHEESELSKHHLV